MSAIDWIEKAVDILFACLPRPTPGRDAAENARLIAHRGAHDSGIAENTDAAFQQALNLGCWGIEFDVHECADGELVIHHDDNLQRMWRVDMNIAEHPYSKIYNAAPLIPRLQDVINQYGRKVHLFIELKNVLKHPHTMISLLKALEPCKDYHVISLEPSLLANLNDLPNESKLLVPLYHNVREFCDLSLKKGYGGVLGHYLLMKQIYIDALIQAGQIAGVGFVDSRYSLYRELRRGIPYVFTNNAVKVTDYLQQLLQRRQS